MVSKGVLFCVSIVSVLVADFSRPGRVEASQQVAFASTSEKAGDIRAQGPAAGSPETGNKGSFTIAATSGTPEGTQLIQYVGEITKWFSITVSVILGICAFLITAVQIGFGIYLSKKEEHSKQMLKEDMANKVEELRIKQKYLVESAIEEYARQFDKTILNEIQRITRRHVEVHNIIERAKMQLMNARLSELSDMRHAEGSRFMSIFTQSMQDTFHLMGLVSGKDMDIFNGLGYIKDQVSGMKKEVRPSAIPDLLRALDARHELQERNNYMIATQICIELYATSLDASAGAECVRLI